jgi:hypothetical protein
MTLPASVTCTGSIDRWQVIRGRAATRRLARPGRPDTAHTARDWLAKLQPAASGYGLTTVPAVIAPGVRVLAARRGPEEQRRVIVAHLPHRLPEPALRVIEAPRAAATGTEAS